MVNIYIPGVNHRDTPLYSRVYCGHSAENAAEVWLDYTSAPRPLYTREASLAGAVCRRVEHG